MNIVICPLSPALFSMPTVHRAAATHTIGLVNALAAKPDIKLRLLYPRLADLSVFSSDVEIVPLDVPRLLQQRLNMASWGLFWNVFVLSNVYRLRRQEAVDVLYVRFSPSIVPSSFLFKAFLSPSLFLYEVNTPAAISAANRGAIVRWFSRIIDKCALAVCDGAFVVSEDLRAILVDQHGPWVEEKLFVTMNGVDPERFRPLHDCQGIRSYRESLGIAANECMVGYVGRPLPHHRLDLVATVVGEISDIPLRMVVAGNFENISKHELEKLGRGKVVFLGPIPYERVPLFLNACDILVLPHGPSYRGLLHQSPIKLFEYMAVGKPVVATKIGQIERVISHSENGLLFGQDDDAQLKEHLETLARDAELRKRLGETARDTVISRYTWDHNACRVLATIEHLRRHRNG